LRLRDTAPPRRGIPLTLVSVGIVALVAGVSAGPEQAAVGALVLLVACLVALRDIRTPVFTWQNALIALFLFVWFVPIRLYTLSVSLPFNLEPYRAILLVLLFAWAVGLMAHRARVDAAGHGKALAAVALVSLASFLVNIGELDSVEGVKSLSFMLSYVAVFLLITSMVESVAQAERLISWIVGGAVVVAVAALYEGMTEYNVFNHLDSWIPALDQLPREVTELRGGRLRVLASSQHPIALGCALTMTVPLAVFLARHAGTRAWSRIWTCAAFVIAAGAFATISRTTVLMAVTMFALLLYLRGRSVLRYWPIVVVLGAVVHLAAPGAIGGLYKSLLPEEGVVADLSGRAGQAGSGRLADLGPAGDLWLEKPVLGHGLGTEELVLDDPEVISAGQVPPEIIFDNQYLNTLVTLGTLGILATAWFTWGAAAKIVGAARRTTGKSGDLMVACGLSSAAFAAGMVFFDAFSFVQGTLLFVVIAAVGLRVAAVCRQEAEEPAPAREPALGGVS
jgi:hypothetical protein